MHPVWFVVSHFDPEYGPFTVSSRNGSGSCTKSNGSGSCTKSLGNSGVSHSQAICIHIESVPLTRCGMLNFSEFFLLGIHEGNICMNKDIVIHSMHNYATLNIKIHARCEPQKQPSNFLLSPLIASRPLKFTPCSDWLRAGLPRGRSSSPGRVKNIHFSISSTPPLGSTQPPIQWVPGTVSPGVKWQWREADHSLIRLHDTVLS
jgi:hypothetical protein